VIDCISFFGLGKLGLPLAALFARSGLRTLAIDIDLALVDGLRARNISYAEPGLDELLADAEPSITYASDTRGAADTGASIILVPTPSDAERPEFSSRDVEQACRDLCAALRTRPAWRYHLFIISSTVFPGTISGRIMPLLEQQLGRRAGKDFGIAYVPDFVALGDIVRGFQEPQFLLIGADDEQSQAQSAALFRRLIVPGTPIQHVSIRDAELTKIAANVFLCTKISFGNFLGQLADRLGGADLDAIASTLGLDPRIGSGFLRAGGPYGGTCLPRDVDAFVALAQSVGLDAPLTRATREVNAAQYDLIERHVLASEPRCVAILGLSFKPGTSVTTGSPAFELARRLAQRQIRVLAYDPAARARDSAHATFGAALTCHDSITACLVGADVVLVCNSDPAFRGLAAKIARDRRIVDPWGCVRGTHPGLIRIGRNAPKDSPGAPLRRKPALRAVR